MANPSERDRDKDTAGAESQVSDDAVDRAPRRDDQDAGLRAGEHGDADAQENVNPPRTTQGGITAPKFGSAGGGGLELEPGPGV